MSGRLTALVIDDNPGDVRLLREMLGPAGSAEFELQSAARLVSGLEQLGAGSIDVVLLDLGLPESQGLDTLERVRAQAPDVPVIVLTGLDNSRMATEAVRSGAQDYLVKGNINPDVLGRAIRYAVERHRLFRELRLRTQEAEEQAIELVQARDAALASTRAKTQFLANVSHETRTPLNGVIGMTEILFETALTPEQHDYATTIRESAKALLDIINDILDFSKLEAGRMSVEVAELNLRTVLEEVADLLAPVAAEKGVEVVCVVPPDFPEELRGDAGRLRQVVTNLVGNAVKFTSAGEVTLEAGLGYQTATHAAIRLSVSDTGIGIPAERLADIFESFTQVDGSSTRRYGGTGLGLAICRQLTELMEGKVVVESEVGKGSTFRVDVVLEKQSHPVAAPAISPRLSGLHLLVAERSPRARTAICDQLRAWGCRVEEVGGGGLERVCQAAERDPFALVLLGADLGDGDGEWRAVAEAVRRSADRDRTPVVVLSRRARRSAEEHRAHGFGRALAKPVHRAALLGAVLAALGEAGEGAAKGPPLTRREAARPALGLRVLVAEDNSINLKVATRLLEQWGCRADGVANGREALAALGGDAYDLVLMDLQMPEMDGFEVTAEIRRQEAGNARRLPIVAVTAHASEDDRARCLAAGMDDYVSKPVEPESLREVVVRWARPHAAQAAGPTRETAPQSPDAFRHDRLRARCGGDAELERELLHEFLNTAPRALSRIATLLGAGDGASVSAESHRLKGACRTVGAEMLGTVCEDMEVFGARGELAAAREACMRAERELARLRPLVAGYAERRADGAG